MNYQLTQEDINSITHPEWAFGTTRLLPKESQIPDEFWVPWDKNPNIYVQIADAMFCGNPAPAGEITFNPGFDGSPEGVQKYLRFLQAHLRSFQPEYEHKIAGLAYMISVVTTIKETK